MLRRSLVPKIVELRINGKGASTKKQGTANQQPQSSIPDSDKTKGKLTCNREELSTNKNLVNWGGGYDREQFLTGKILLRKILDQSLKCRENSERSVKNGRKKL